MLSFNTDQMAIYFILNHEKKRYYPFIIMFTNILLKLVTNMNVSHS